MTQGEGTIAVEANHHQRLIEKLRRIETLFADRAATVGEKAAAEEARLVL